MVLTHELVSASRLHEDLAVVTDQYIDGAMWVIADFDQPSGDLQTLITTFEDHLAVAEGL